METFTKTFKGYEDYANQKYYSDTETSIGAIRYMFAAIQAARGESDFGSPIRLRKRLVSCTVEGMTYEYSNRGRTALVTHRTYDSVVTLSGEMVTYKTSLYWSPD